MEKFNFNIQSVIDCLVPSTVTMITGGPGVGKTTLALNIATQYGVNEGKTVAIFQLEQSASEVELGILSMLSNICLRSSYKNQLNLEDLKRIECSVKDLEKSKIFIEDSAYITLQEIENKIEKLIKKHGCVDLIIIDYFQLLYESRDIQVSVETVNKLKFIAKKFNAPILLLSQMGRDGKGGWKNTYPSSIVDTCISMVRIWEFGGYYQEKDFYMTFDYGKCKGKKILLDCDFHCSCRMSEKI